MIIVYVQNNKRSSPYHEDVDQLPDFLLTNETWMLTA